MKNRPRSEKRPLNLEDLWAMARLGAPVVSPDGSRVVVPVSCFDREENRSTTHLWLVPADGSAAPRRLTRGGGRGEESNGGKDTAPVFNPDGSSLAFVSKRDDGPAQLYLLPMAGGEAEPLTDLPVAVLKPCFFPDGRRIAFAASTFPDLNDDFEAVKERLEEQEEDPTQVKISDRRLVRYWDEYRTDGRVHHLFVLDLESREVRDLTPELDNLTAFREFAWELSPDGRQIAFAANTTAPPWQTLRFDLHLLDVESGETRRLADEDETSGEVAWNTAPRYSPDGRYLLFARTHRPMVAADFSRLARYDRESGEVVELTAGLDLEPSGWRATHDGGTVVFHAQRGGRQHLYALPIDGGELRLLYEGGMTSSVEPGPDGRLYFLLQSLTAPPELMVLDPHKASPRGPHPQPLSPRERGEEASENRTAAQGPHEILPLSLGERGLGGEGLPLTAFNDSRLADLDLGTVEDVTFEGAAGDPVQMWVMRPPGYDPSHRHPLLLLLHGGPHSAWLDSFHFRWSTALFAAQGYLTAAVNFHGSTGFGQAFAESIVGDQAELPFEDVMRATDLFAARDDVDPERMVAAGGSYGGYLVSWILGHSDRFKALVSHAGVYDLMAQFASDYTWHRDVHYGAAPWTDPAGLDRQSPNRHAANFKTPTLILHGELDYRVPVTQALELHHVLLGKGVPSRLVIFPKENHWIEKPQAAEIWWREVLAWLDGHLESPNRLEKQAEQG